MWLKVLPDLYEALACASGEWRHRAAAEQYAEAIRKRHALP